MKSHKQAFTLIELLVAVLIIGALSTVAIPIYQRAVKKAGATGAWTAMKATSDAMNRYYLQNGEYPDSFDVLDVESTKIKGFEASVEVGFPKYLDQKESITLAEIGTEGVAVALGTEEENGDCKLKYNLVRGKLMSIETLLSATGMPDGTCAWLNPCSRVSDENCPFGSADSNNGTGTDPVIPITGSYL